MTDHELLTFAAKAAGIGDVDVAGRPCVLVVNDSGISQRCWNPLTDDGDALRLAVKKEIFTNKVYYVLFLKYLNEELANDLRPSEATRRAIVRAAAEIGKEMI